MLLILNEAQARGYMTKVSKEEPSGGLRFLVLRMTEREDE